MKDRELKRYLRQSFRQEAEAENPPAMLEETVKLCTGIMREQKLAQKPREEPRTGFVRYLSDIFRYEGVPVLGLHAIALFIICIAVSTVADSPKYIPVFMPFFALAVMLLVFKCQYYGMGEIEAATRASGSQIILAKLILAGAANLVCMTVLILFEVHLQDSGRKIGQMILYCLVPYLVCMASMLYLIRQRRKESMQVCMVIIPGFCVCWGVAAGTMPWLYEESALGLWVVAFLFFAAFFIKEIYFIITMGKEGKKYGIIA